MSALTLWWVNQGVDAPPVTTPVPQSAPYTLFDYDANGRMEARERKYGATLTRTLAFQWDSDDRLRKVMDGATTRLDAGYSGDGLRVTKTENWPGLPGAPLSHTYSWGPGGVVHDTAGGGNGTVYTPGLAQRVNTTETFFHTDWLGSTRYLSGSTGAWPFPSKLTYDAFGNRSTTTGAFHPSDSQFAGAWGYQQEWSSATEPGLGLQYLQQRYYDPTVGRFISPDPIGFEGGLNLYDYVNGDPVNGIDPEGLSRAFDPRLSVSNHVRQAIYQALNRARTDPIGALQELQDLADLVRGDAGVATERSLDRVIGFLQRRVTRLRAGRSLYRPGYLGRFTRVVTPWGRNVWQRNDIDWNLTRLDGLTNLQAARRGLTPQRYVNGRWEKLNLHHMNQEKEGSLAEVWEFLHDQVPHNVPPPSWRVTDPAAKEAFKYESFSYWRLRARQVGR